MSNAEYGWWMCGFTVAAGAGEVGHHWASGTGWTHGGWLGVALMIGGTGIGIAMGRARRRRERRRR